MKSVLSVFVFLLPVITFASPPTGFRRLEEPCLEGRAAFEKTVLAKVQRDCAVCHAPGGMGPTFILDDVSTSYLRVKNYVDFVDLNRSLLAVRSGNNHCGRENCNESSGKEMKELLADWWEGGEKSCERFGKYFSNPITAPADLPVDLARWKKLEWDLSGISEDLGGVKFSVEAQHYSLPSGDGTGAYRFRKPRVHFGFEPIRVKGLRILINGKHDRLANAYEKLDQTTAPQESKGGAVLDYPLLSTQAMILLQEKSKGDTFTLAFDDIAIVDRPRCRSLDRFKSVVIPAAAKAQCTSCHTASGTASSSVAVGAFSMDLDLGNPAEPGQLCSAFLQRSYLSQPLRSPLIELSVRGKFGHPVDAQGAQDFSQGIQQWLSTELSPGAF